MHLLIKQFFKQVLKIAESSGFSCGEFVKKSLRPDYEFALRQYAMTPEDVPDWFPKDQLDCLEFFGLEVNSPNYEECVLFAR